MEYKATILYKKVQSGISLPLAIIFTLISTGYLFSYILSIYDKDWTVEFNIAQTKAAYNADSGIALDAYTILFRKDYIPSSSDTLSGYVDSDCINDAQSTLQKNKCMGGYNLERFETVDPQTYQIYRGCNSTGVATVEKHLFSGRDNNIQIKRHRKMTLGHTSSLSDFQYLTASEKAGGHPWVYENYSECTEENRRDVYWGAGDVMNQDWFGEPTCDDGFKTNGTFVMSNYGAPTFNITVSVIDNGDGTYNSPQGPTQGGNVFQGDPALDTVRTTCLPPPGYEQMKRVIEYGDDHLFIDATKKMKFQSDFSKRDTLIMTDIEFFTEPTGSSGFHVKQWWYLMPPYLDDFGGASFSCNEGQFQCNQDPPFNDQPNSNVFPTHLGFNGMFNVGNCDNAFGFQFPLKKCQRYEEMLELFHNTTLTENTFQEVSMDALGTAIDDTYGCSRGNTGFKHFDVPEMYALYESLEKWDTPAWEGVDWVSQFEIDRKTNSGGQWVYADGGDGIEDHLLPEYITAGGRITYYYDDPIAIYVKGGPVRVKGRYKGRYTIVTDEFQTYHRHAWGVNTPGDVPEDTLWTDIFITDDLINADAINGSLLAAQPNESCSIDTGSDNRLGLVSGSNLYIANTIENGARGSEISFCDLNDDGVNENYTADKRHITIHAHMIAFNESFASNYSNNTYNQGNAETYSFPPYGDGMGLLKYGGTSANQCDGGSNTNDGVSSFVTGGDESFDGFTDEDGNLIAFPLPDGSNHDERGTITIWGGVVQKNRGFVVRNGPAPYPYDTDNIGHYSKNYNFDCNLKCPGGFPPLYPENTTCDESSDEIPYKVTAYY